MLAPLSKSAFGLKFATGLARDAYHKLHWQASQRLKNLSGMLPHL